MLKNNAALSNPLVMSTAEFMAYNVIEAHYSLSLYQLYPHIRIGGDSTSVSCASLQARIKYIIISKQERQFTIHWENCSKYSNNESVGL